MSKVLLPIGIDSEEMGHEVELEGLEEDFEPYDVTCDGCGKVLSCVDAMVEEGDRWECGECWDRFNEQEKLERMCQMCSKPATNEMRLCGSEECLERYRAAERAEYHCETCQTLTECRYVGRKCTADSAGESL